MTVYHAQTTTGLPGPGGLDADSVTALSRFVRRHVPGMAAGVLRPPWSVQIPVGACCRAGCTGCDKAVGYQGAAPMAARAGARRRLCVRRGARRGDTPHRASTSATRVTREPARNAMPCARHRRLQEVGDPGRTRTCDLQLRRLLLYPLSYGAKPGSPVRVCCSVQAEQPKPI
jgi:hypothetical protein